MLRAKNIIPSASGTEKYKYIFDFAKEGTIGRAIFEDNVDSPQQLLATRPYERRDFFHNNEMRT